jgi:hypothetical protein
VSLLGRRARRRADRRAERLADAQAQAEVDALVLAWERACEGAGLVRTVPTVSGPTVIVPAVVFVVLGPPMVLAVRLEPGMTAADVRAAAGRLAPHLGVYGLRVEPIGVGAHVHITLLRADPLAAAPGPTSAGAAAFVVELGHDEQGQPVRISLDTAAHLIVQGATRAGKSVALYGLLAQVVERNAIAVTGCDPTGLLLAPWMTRGGPFSPAVGTRDPAAHVALLEALTADMDARVAALPAGSDGVALGMDCPLRLVLLEEYPGLLRVLDAHDKTLGKRARAAVARLLGEGAKAGLRIVVVAQRAEATIIGGFERGQASHRLSFRVDTADAVKMLHPDVPPEVTAAHATAAPGIALLTAPGEPLRRLRVPATTYAAYVAAVTGGGAL